MKLYEDGPGKLSSGQDIVEDFQKWREGGLIDKLKAAVEEVEKEGDVMCICDCCRVRVRPSSGKSCEEDCQWRGVQ